MAAHAERGRADPSVEDTRGRRGRSERDRRADGVRPIAVEAGHPAIDHALVIRHAQHARADV